MDTAVNAITGEIVTAWNIRLNPSYQFPEKEKWYADTNEIESFDPIKVPNIKEIEVRFRSGSESVINYNGTEYAIAPHFFILNKTELGINTIPESKEHRAAKNWIYNRIKNKNLVFVYSSAKRPFDYDNTIGLEQLKIDYTKIGIEQIVKNNRTQRADIIIPFTERDNLLGCGIVIEIQFSKQFQSTEDRRSKDWAFKGYSIVWLHMDSFKELSESIIELKEDRLLLEPLYKILDENKKESEIEMKNLTQNLSRMIDLKMKELNYPFAIGECNKCGEGYMTKKRAKASGKQFYGCSNYPNCRHCIWIGDDNDSD